MSVHELILEPNRSTKKKEASDASADVGNTVTHSSLEAQPQKTNEEPEQTSRGLQRVTNDARLCLPPHAKRPDDVIRNQKNSSTGAKPLAAS